MNATPISGKPSYNVSTSHILQDYQTLKKAALESLDGELPVGAIDLGECQIKDGFKLDNDPKTTDTLEVVKPFMGFTASSANDVNLHLAFREYPDSDNGHTMLEVTMSKALDDPDDICNWNKTVAGERIGTATIDCQTLQVLDPNNAIGIYTGQPIDVFGDWVVADGSKI